MSSRTAYGVDVQTEREAGFLTCEFLIRIEKLAAPNGKLRRLNLSIYSPWEKERERLAPSSFNVSFDHVVHVDERIHETVDHLCYFSSRCVGTRRVTFEILNSSILIFLRRPLFRREEIHSFNDSFELSRFRSLVIWPTPISRQPIIFIVADLWPVYRSKLSPVRRRESLCWLEILRQGINRRDLPSIPRVESVVVVKEDRVTRGNAVATVGHDFGLIVINGHCATNAFFHRGRFLTDSFSAGLSRLLVSPGFFSRLFRMPKIVDECARRKERQLS